MPCHVQRSHVCTLQHPPPPSHNTPAQFTPGMVHTACCAASTRCVSLCCRTHTMMQAAGNLQRQRSRAALDTITLRPTPAAWQSCTACSSTTWTAPQSGPSLCHSASTTKRPPEHPMLTSRGVQRRAAYNTPHAQPAHSCSASCALLWHPVMPVLRPCVQLSLLRFRKTAVMAAACQPPLPP
jgi:hypothetical protein